jgi:hypothetical protein
VSSQLPTEFRAGRAVVRFSPSGVEWTDRRGRTTRLSWPDITAVGLVRSGLRRRPGLIGPSAAIPLGTFDPHWTYGAMGAWVRVFRPDLL